MKKTKMRTRKGPSWNVMPKDVVRQDHTPKAPVSSDATHRGFDGVESFNSEPGWTGGQRRRK